MKSNLILLFVLLFDIGMNAQSIVQTHGNLSVVGNQIVNKNNQPISFAGASLFWSNNHWGGEAFYNAQTISWLVSDWDINIVRAAMGVEDNGGYLSDRSGNKAKVNTVVSAAINEGIYVIIDWHSHHAENHQADAIAFFQEMATLYSQYDNVIYEIYNEPLQVSWNNVIKPYATAVIAAIRAIDPDNLIVVGTPTWSQDVDVASLNPITGYNNIAYTLHFYAATHKQSIRNKAITALNNGIALMVTEWGTVSANGNGAVDQASTNDWMTFLCNNNISHCNWAINDKVEGASALIQGASTTGNWTMNDLTASGRFVRNLILNWGGSCSITTTPQTAYGGTPHLIPGQVEAEYYDLGGEGVAYHDLNSGNTGNQFRTDDVDIGGTGDISGAYDIGWAEGGEWLEYTINCTTTGTYDFSMRVASALNTAKYKILIDGIDQTGDVMVPNTGSWQTYQTINNPNINIAIGIHVVRIEIVSSGVNLNYWAVSASSSSPQTAYGGTPHLIPGRVEAEHYDLGGEGIAYHDLNSGNTGNQFRTDDVDVETTGDLTGAYNVGWTGTGEWLEYTINCTATGTYNFSTRVASALSTAKYRVLIDGVNKTGDVMVPNTGSWQNYQTINNPNINIAAGIHVVRIEIVSNGVNLNYWTVSASSSNPQTAYSGTPHLIPGQVEAEHYDLGGEGIAYHDLNSGNMGNQFRTDDVDIGGTGDVSGGHDIGWTEGGEWLEYTVNCTATNNYNFSMRISSPLNTAKYRILIDGVNKTGDVMVPNTGSWQNYQTINNSNINIAAGIHVVRIEIVSGGVNINHWAIGNTPINSRKSNQLTSIDNNRSLSVYPNPADQQFITVEFKNLRKQATLQIVDLQGKILKEQLLITPYNKIDLTNLYSGVFLVKIMEDDFIITRKIIIQK